MTYYALNPHYAMNDYNVGIVKSAMKRIICLVLFGFAVVTALPSDPIIRKTDPLRFQYADGPDGLFLADTWLKVSDLSEVARFDPDKQNAYHLFTRDNPTTSQPLLAGNPGLLATTNYDPEKRTVFLVHGWRESAVSDFNSVLVPAFLAAEELNVIIVDWSAGAANINILIAGANAVPSGESVARFIDWLVQTTGTSSEKIHLVGAGVGGQKIGIIGRNVQQPIGYITALDPALAGWHTNENRLAPDDSLYTEVIHTNAGINGFVLPMGHTDFYPNGGVAMPGCGTNPNCSSERAWFYFAESVSGVGTFTGRRCVSYLTAMTGNCFLPFTLVMGGITPKTGSTGIFHLETNASPPFARG